MLSDEGNAGEWWKTTIGLRACLHEGGGPQIGEVTPLGGVKNNPPLHAILQPPHPGVHFLEITECSLST